MRRNLQAGCLGLVLSLAGMVAAPPATAQLVSDTTERRAQRLILKDGSYQLATQWEVKGERVRFYSAERFAWEEIPKSLVDWPATERYNAERDAKKSSDDMRILDDEARKEMAAELARTPEIAPGIRLPEGGGVLLLDQFQGKPQLIEVVQSGSEINKQTGRNILRAAINPIASVKQAIELPGDKARVQAHVTQPVLYVLIDPGDEEAAGAEPRKEEVTPTVDAAHRFRLVRAEVKKGKRVVGNLKITIIGRASQQHSAVETIIEPFTGGWIKITPAQPLPAGEYALVEMLGEKEMNLYVWDFGVNPAAPENPAQWRPAAPKPKPTGTEKTPVVDRRK